MTARIARLFVLGLLAFASAEAFAQSPPPAPLPTWEQLTPQQREAWMQKNAPRRRPSREEH